MNSLRQLSMSKFRPLAGFLDHWEKILEKHPSLKSLSEKMSPERRFSLGLDLGTHALRYVFLDPVRGQILKWGSVILDSGRYKQEAEKKEVRPLPAILKDLIKKLPKAQIARCAINLQDLSVVTGNLQLPNSSKEDPHLVRLAISDQTTFPVEEASYLCSESKQLPDGRALLNFAAVPRKVVEKLIDPIDEALAIVPDVTLQGYALESIMKTLDLAAPGQVSAFLNVGRSMTIVSIFQGSKLLFERYIPLGGQDMTRAIFIMYLAGQAPRTAQDLDQAEKVKRECYLPLAALAGKKTVSRGKPSEDGSALSEEENRKLFKVINGLLGAWVQDIRLSFSFFNEHYVPDPISKIYLTGGGANLRNFDSYLSAELDIPAQILPFPKDGPVSVIASPESTQFKEQFHEYVPALALALKPEGYATLTPPEFKTLALEQMARSIIRLGSIVIFVLLLIWYIFLVFENQHLTAMKTAFLKNHGLIEQAEGPYLAMRRWETFLSTLDIPIPQASVILKVISRKIPSNMVLSHIVIQRERRTLLLEGIITGDAKRCAVTLSEFSKLLEDSGYFKKIEIPTLNPNALQPGTRNFYLTADLVSVERVKP